MIVSLAIFTIVALVAIGALLKVVDANKKSQSLKVAINNLNFALESMSREMRVGSNYYCTSGSFNLTNDHQLPSPLFCNPGASDWVIAFYSSQSGGTCSLVHAYHFSGGTIEKAEQPSCDSDMGLFTPIISSDLTFQTATVQVQTGSSIQPYARFHFKGYSGVKEKNRSYFDIQTSVSQRVND